MGLVHYESIDKYKNKNNNNYYYFYRNIVILGTIVVNILYVATTAIVDIILTTTTTRSSIRFEVVLLGIDGRNRHDSISSLCRQRQQQNY